MKVTRTKIGLLALAMTIFLNLSYAYKGYGLRKVFADNGDPDTFPDEMFECDTQDGRKVYCNARERSSFNSISCPYYTIKFLMEVECVDQTTGISYKRILEDGPYGSFSSMVYERTPSFKKPSNCRVIRCWDNRSQQPVLVPNTFVECEYINNADSRCSPIMKSCSDFVSDDGSGEYIGV